MKMIKKTIRTIWALRHRGEHVVIDGRANSVTVSKRIYRHIMRHERDGVAITVFRASDTQCYCFAVIQDFPQLMEAQTYCCPLQYNEEHRKIGFRTDNPSATAILDDYGLPIDRMVRLDCVPRVTATGDWFYEIQRPNLKQ